MVLALNVFGRLAGCVRPKCDWPRIWRHKLRGNRHFDSPSCINLFTEGQDTGVRALRLAALFLLAFPAWATYTVSSATVQAVGYQIVANVSSPFVSGSAAGCFSISGGASTQSNVVSSVTWTSGSAPVINLTGPVYAPDTVTVNLLVGCAVVTSAGVALGSSVTATNSSGYYAASSAHWTGCTVQGSAATGTDGNGYPQSLTWNSPTGSMDCNLTSSGGTIYLWMLQLNNAITMLVDNVISSRNVLSSGGTYAETSFSGLDTGAHTFSMRQSSASSTWQAAIINAIRIPSAVQATTPAGSILAGACGPSTTDMTGSGSATNNVDQTDKGILGQALGVTFQGRSFSGQNLFTTLRDSCPAGIVPGGGGTETFAFLENLAANDAITNVSLANDTSAAQTLVTNTMANAHPPAKLFVEPILPGPNYVNAGGTCSGLTATQCWALYSAAVDTGVTAAANANTTLVHTTALPNGGPPWLSQVVSASGTCAADTTSDWQSDGLHPCPATQLATQGYGKVANRMVPIINGVTLGHSFTAAATAGYGCSTVALAIPGGSTATGNPKWADVLTATSSNTSDSVIFSAAGSTQSAHSATLVGNAGTNTVQASVCGPTGIRNVTYSNAAEGWVVPAPTSVTINQACCIVP
jgi:hypothetical protein